MALYDGNGNVPIEDVQETMYGISIPIDYIYEGTSSGANLIWERASWFFTDNFNRTSLGSDWYPAEGSVLVNGELRRNTNNGSSDNWIAQTFPTDHLLVRTTIGTVSDPIQVSSIVLGAPGSHYVYFEFASGGSGQIGVYNGSTWTRLATLSAFTGLKRGDVVEVRRAANWVGIYLNGDIRGSATTSVALGASFRRVNLAVRCYVGGVTRYYSPTFDDVKVGAFA